MPLAFTQENFLVQDKISMQISIEFKNYQVMMRTNLKVRLLIASLYY